MIEAGIITLHFSVNYGAVLQCLALSETLKKHQIHATVINYYPRYAHYYWEPVKRYSDAIRDAIRSGKSKSATGEDLRKSAVVRCLKSLKYVYKANQEADSYRKKYNAFREFIAKNLLLTEQYEDITEMEDLSFDLLISGSDQVWNSNYTDYTFDKVYFLQFGKPEARRVAYAVSTHIYKSNEDWEEIVKLSKDFERISVRENKICNKLNTAYGKDRATVVLDPSLLLTATEWSKFEKESHFAGNYVLVYCLHERDICLKYVAAYTDESCYSVIDISPNRLSDKFMWQGDCGPDVFLNLLHNAQVVITDSFHGTAFSIIYNKQFVSIVREETDTRITDLLELLGLGDMHRNCFEELPCKDIDYTVVNDKLDVLRKRSLKFLFAE